jgi:hypothetical protein
MAIILSLTIIKTLKIHIEAPSIVHTGRKQGTKDGRRVTNVICRIYRSFLGNHIAINGVDVIGLGALQNGILTSTMCTETTTTTTTTKQKKESCKNTVRSH